jgi:predicted lipoprotein
MRNLLATIPALMLAVTILSGCKIEPTGEIQPVAGKAGSSPAATAGGAADPADLAARDWEGKVLPYLQGKAGEFAELRQTLATAPDEVGRQHGYRPKEEGTPWNIVVRASGTIVEANTKSRAATAGLDTDGDGKADLTAQLGPVIRGTAIRDVLDFVRFEDFSNQIAFANFGKALNTQASDRVLAGLPREGLVGRRMTLLGVFTYDKPGQPPLVTPVEASVE